MPYRLASHVHVAFPAGRAIILDTCADRYQRAGERQSACLRRLAAGETSPTDAAAVHAMLERGLLVGTPVAEPWPLLTSRPLRLGPAATNRSSVVASANLIALARAQLTLRLLGLGVALTRARRHALLPRVDDPHRAVEMADGVHQARRWFPLEARCLARSLALHERLCKNAIACSLVIGVRDQPFAAHCWVETGDHLLTDDLDTVRELTPILRL